MKNTRTKLNHRVLLFVVLFAVIVTSASVATAQSFFGSISGTVKDPTGANIPGASVTITNTGTNSAETTQADAAGNYRVLNLVPGHYRLEITMTGFRKLVRPDVEVQVQSDVRIDEALQVGQTNQTVEVTSQTPSLDTENATISQVVDQRTVQDMPLAGRNVNSLIALGAGVVPQASATGQTTVNSNAGTFALTTSWGNYQIGGGIANQNAVLLDGAPIIQSYGAAVALVPTQDAVSEFRISANNVTADYGRSSGGVVNSTIKSGTNTYHGALYEYLRNTDFNANAFFNKILGTPRPEFNQSQYGATIGGPIMKNKLFAFLGGELQQTHLQGSSLLSTPTAAEKNGDFSAVGVNIYDPLTICGFYGNAPCQTNPATGQPIYIRQQFPGNKIPANRWDPTANVYKHFWEPGPNSSNPNLLVNNYSVNQSIKANQAQGNARLDYVASDKQRTFAHYTYWRGNQSPGLPFTAHITGNYLTFFTHDLVLGDTYVINPNTVADIRVGYLRYAQHNIASSYGQQLSQFGPNWAGLANQVNFQAYPSAVVQGLFGFGYGQSVTQNTSDVYTLNGSVTKVIGRHSLKFGGETHRMEWYFYNSVAANGNFSFDNGFTSQNPQASSGSGLGFASFLLGFPSSGYATETRPDSQYEFYTAVYAQDQFKISNKMQVIYGLRWDVSPGAWQEKHGVGTVFLPNATDPFGATVGLSLTGVVAPLGSSAYSTTSVHPSDRTLFAPRIGVTYLLTPNTVVRTGYSVMYTPTNANTNDAPWASSAATATTNIVATMNGGLTPAATYAPTTATTAGPFWNPFPTGVLQAPGRNATALSTAVHGTAITNPVPNSSFPYMQQYNLDLETQAYKGILLGGAYVGAKGTRLYMNGNPQLNQLADGNDALGSQLTTQVANPFYGVLPQSAGLLATSPTVARGQLLRPYPQYLNVINTSLNVGVLKYNSLQLRAERRWGKAGTLTANYTWSKQMGNTDSLATAGGAPGVPQDWTNLKAEYSLMSFDTPHRGVISYVLGLPIGRGRKFFGNSGHLLDTFIGGWAVNGVSTFQSGFPLPFTATNTSLANNFGAGTPRPNITPGCTVKKNGPPALRLTAANPWFNTACFTAPSTYGFGNAPRVLGIRAQGIDNFDFALSKVTHLTDSLNFELRGEAFNLFNHTQFNPPATQFGSSNFGITSASIGSQANSPRLIQVAARFNF